jgi:fucose permease
LCFLLFLYIAEEVGYAGWIPTYAFKAQVADEKAASALASIFWIVNTIARLVLLYMKGTVAERLMLLLQLLVGSTFLVLVIQWMGYLALVAYLGMISSGIFLSAMYALFFSLAQEYGYELSTSSTANLAMSASLGEGFLVMPIGYVMGLLGFKALIYIIFIFSAVMYLVFTYVNNFMQEDSKKKKEGMMTPLK